MMRFLTLSVIRWLSVLTITVLLLGCNKPHEENAETLSTFNNRTDITTLLSHAEKGKKDAQFALAVKYHLGDGGNADLMKAAFWYEKAANSGHLGAMNNLAALYYDGKGVKQDFQKSFELYKKVSEAGDISGTASLAGFYLDGKGVAQDYNEARRLYMIAADHGYGPAQNAVGMMYKFGWGVSQDNVEAYAWWILASSNGDTVAADNMKELSAKLTESDIARAQMRSKQLLVSKN